MPAEDSDGSETDASVRTEPRPARPSTVRIVRSALRRSRRDPVLLVPFAVVGVLVALVDWLRQHDPIPVTAADVVDQSVSIQYSLLPRGTARTARHVDALVDLETPYLLWALGLEAVVPLAVGVAGWMTVARTLESNYQLGALSRYLIASVAINSIPQLLGVSSVNIDSFLLGLSFLAVVVFVFVRLFLFPAFLVTGSGFVAALRQSYRKSRGNGMTIAGLIIGIGLAYWALALVPFAGGLLSTALVAPIHAIALGIVASSKTGGVDGNPSLRPDDRDGGSAIDR